jgi:hypothetical protein
VVQTHPQLVAKGMNRQVYRPVGVPVTDPESQARLMVGEATFDKADFIQQQLHFYRTLNVGMAGMMHEKDVRVAEGLTNLELPDNFGEALPAWNIAISDAIMEWNQRQGIDMPDLNYIRDNGMFSAVDFCFPHYFLLPFYSSSSAYRIRPLGPEECLFELWSLTRYPPGQQPPAPPKPSPWAPNDPRCPPIPTQDYSNLPRQQRGLHAQGFEYMRLSGWVEGMISNYHRLIDGYLAGLSYDQLVPATHQVVGSIDVESRDIGF